MIKKFSLSFILLSILISCNKNDQNDNTLFQNDKKKSWVYKDSIYKYVDSLNVGKRYKLIFETIVKKSNCLCNTNNEDFFLNLCTDTLSNLYCGNKGFVDQYLSIYKDNSLIKKMNKKNILEFWGEIQTEPNENSGILVNVDLYVGTTDTLYAFTLERYGAYFITGFYNLKGEILESFDTTKDPKKMFVYETFKKERKLKLINSIQIPQCYCCEKWN